MSTILSPFMLFYVDPHLTYLFLIGLKVNALSYIILILGFVLEIKHLQLIAEFILKQLQFLI